MKAFARPATLLLLLQAACLTHGFKFMSNWKLPGSGAAKSAADAAVSAQFGEKKLVVITGTSSGLGRKTAKALLETGDYHVVGAVRDLDKMEAVAEIDGFDPASFTPMHVELTSFESVRNFCDELKEWKGAKPLDRLICNAAVYQPSLPVPKWTVDGHEQQMQINFLSQFLLLSKLLPDLTASDDPRVILVGSVTGNDNTVGGGGVYPIADLKSLDGLRQGARRPVAMFDGYEFDGAKAYKDSKLCLMMMSHLLHVKYHKQTGIAFSSIYPGCIAESPLFREKRAWCARRPELRRIAPPCRASRAPTAPLPLPRPRRFRKYFPVFMKFITGGFVSETEAGMRLMQVAHDPRCSKSGVYWSWNGGPREGREAALETGGQISGAGGAGGGWDSIFENDQSNKVLDIELAVDLFQLSTQATGAEWPDVSVAVSPCPTLRVIGALTERSNKKQDAKRKKQDATMPALASKADLSKLTKKHRKFLESLPAEAIAGSEYEEILAADAAAAAEEEEAPELDLAPVAAVAAAAAAEEERLLAEVECADDEECEVSDAAEALSQEALSAVRRMRRGTAEECEGEEECMVPM